MQWYLQYAELEKQVMKHFDAWASTFGETTTFVELAPEGGGYRARTRFAKFQKGARASCPQIVEKYGLSAGVPQVL